MHILLTGFVLSAHRKVAAIVVPEIASSLCVPHGLHFDDRRYKGILNAAL